MNLRSQADHLISSIEAAQEERAELERTKDFLLKEERRIRDLEKDILSLQKKQQSEQAEIKQERLFIAKELLRIKREDTRLKKQLSVQEEVRKDLDQLDEKIAEFTKLKEEVHLERLKLEKTKTSLEDIERRERLVTKSEKVDQERKRLLDLREKRIIEAEKRWQLDQSFAEIS